MTHEIAHTILRDRWKAAGEYPRMAPDGASKVKEIEKRYAISLPEDFRLYLTEAAPAEDFWDQDDVIWWEPSRIKNIPEEYEHSITNPQFASKASKYLFFADYCLWFWAWAICCDEGADHGKVVLITGIDDSIIADSFTAFAKAYAADAMSNCPS